MSDMLRRWFLRFGRPDSTDILRRADVDALDERLNELEREQNQIAARLRLLEIQSNPRGQPHG